MLFSPYRSIFDRKRKPYSARGTDANAQEEGTGQAREKVAPTPRHVRKGRRIPTVWHHSASAVVIIGLLPLWSCAPLPQQPVPARRQSIPLGPAARLVVTQWRARPQPDRK